MNVETWAIRKCKLLVHLFVNLIDVLLFGKAVILNSLFHFFKSSPFHKVNVPWWLAVGISVSHCGMHMYMLWFCMVNASQDWCR